jgi:DNA mismatch repair protein MutS
MAPRSTRIVARSAKAKGSSSKDTPMMEQFWRAKKEAPGALLFFRMGDFYELFHDDAVTVARHLGLTLTSRSKGSASPIPMAGIPVKSLDTYLMRLVKKGFKVAICEQLTDPRESKGIVERGIVRIVTAGTLTEENALDARSNNYLAALAVGRTEAGLAWVDLSTGRLLAAELSPKRVLDELGRIQPAELLLSPELLDQQPGWGTEITERMGLSVTEREPWRFDGETARRSLTKHFGVLKLDGFGIEENSAVIPAAGALLEYISETQQARCAHILRIEKVSTENHLVLDRATRTCLELVQTQRDGRREGTLLEVLDDTRTPMGSRLLREWVLSPLCDVARIRHRQQGVAELVESTVLREDIRDLLHDVLDMERLVGKISTGRCNARDLVSLAASMRQLPPLREKLNSSLSSVLGELRDDLDPLDDLTKRIDETLVDEPPMTIKEGGIIRSGICPELDELRQIAGDGKSWMARFQTEESQRSGIPGLKIGFNSVFGYFIEVPRGQIERVPEHYVRKQTIKTAERYITPELKEFETKVLKSEELSQEREYVLFCELKEEVAAEVRRVLESAHAVARIDTLASLAEVAAQNRYVAPEVDDSDELDITEGRHPVLEGSSSCENFVPNDARLNRDSHRLTILTGPNMAGKSTYIRQVALITLLAQIGSFVPADSARIGVVDRIFTRVGAGDDISRGDSTFMVEMVEIANILNNASARSLIILDEVGRGTSTFDGLALAWSIAEHLHEHVAARTLFATHYHQLTDLSTRYPGAVNRNVAVREMGDEIVFLHKILVGGTDRSYGIHVARLAGVPREVIDRAKAILRDLERDEEGLAQRILSEAPAAAAAPLERQGAGVQLGLFAAPSPIEEALRSADLDSMTPLRALTLLQELKDKL